MTQQELAAKLSCSKAKVSKIEAGVVLIDGAMLRALSAALDYPEGFFLQQERRLGIGVSEFFHRKKSSLGVRALDAIHADLDILRLHLKKLVKAVDLGQVAPWPKLDIDDYGDPTEIARMVRATWQLPSGPLKNLTVAVEEAGGVVVRRDFGTPLVDGISRVVPGLPPMFFLNAALAPDRYRFTLAHELGHAVMHDSPNQEIEEQANRFAAELLMPAADIRASLTGISLQRLVALKQVWRVSMGALLMRAHHLGTITERQYRYLQMQMSKLGYRTREPAELDPPQEEPSLLRDVVRYHTGHLGYSASDLSQFLCAPEKDVISTYGLQEHGRPRLRVL